MVEEKTYYQIYGIRRPYRDFKMLDEFEYCPLCKTNRQLCKVGMMRDFRFGWKRCSICLVKIPLPLKIQAFLKRFKKKQIHKDQTVLL